MKKKEIYHENMEIKKMFVLSKVFFNVGRFFFSGGEKKDGFFLNFFNSLSGN